MLVEQLFGEDTMYSGSEAWLSSATAGSISVFSYCRFQICV